MFVSTILAKFFGGLFLCDYQVLLAIDNMASYINAHVIVNIFTMFGYS